MQCNLILLFVSQLSLVSSLVIKYINAPTILNERMVEIIFKTTIITEASIHRILKILLQMNVNLQSCYFATCAYRSWADFEVLLEVAENLPSQYRELLLSYSCISKMEFADEARQLIASRKWLMAVPDLDECIDISCWKVVVSNAERYPSWCSKIPSSYFGMSELWEDSDVIGAVHPDCLTRDWPNVDEVIGLLIDRIETASEESITKFLYSLSRVDETVKLLKLLKDAIASRLSKFDLETPLKTLYEILLGLRGKPLGDWLNVAFREAITEDNPDRSVILIKMWFQYSSVEDVALTLLLNPVDLSGASHLSLFSLLTDYAFAEYKVDLLFQLFNHIKVPLTDLLFSLPPSRNAVHPLRPIAKMTLGWRINYYQKWMMKPPRRKHKIMDQPGHYHNTTFEKLKENIKELVSDSKQFACEQTDDGILIIQPMDWMCSSEIWEEVLHLMIYSLVVFKRPVALLDSNFCKYVPSIPYSYVPPDIRHRTIIHDTASAWNLYNIIYSHDVYKFLSTSLPL